MSLLFAFIFWLLLFAFVALFFRRRIEHILEAEQETSVEESLPQNVEYRTRRRVMNNSEAAFFYLLEKGLAEEFFVFPKMRIADILETVDGDGYYKRRNRILPKHVDFLICDLQFKPLLVIEVDGSSHRNERSAQSDQQKDEVFSKAGLTLKRIAVGSDFQTQVEEVKTLLNGSMRRSR